MLFSIELDEYYSMGLYHDMVSDPYNQEFLNFSEALTEFNAPTNFKSYDELKIRLSMVLAGTTTVGNVTTLMEDEPTATVTVDTKEEPAPTVTVEDNNEDTMDYFQKLAENN